MDRAPAALLTGVTIGLYTVVDAMGARASGNAVSYIAVTSAMWMVMTVITYLAVRGPRMNVSPRDIATAAVGGTVAFAGYSAVIWATTQAPMGPVSALRETSVVFAAVIARVFLGEHLSAWRLTACVVIAAGAALLA